MKVSSVVAEFFTCGWTDGQTKYRQMDRHDEANSRSSKFCKCA